MVQRIAIFWDFETCPLAEQPLTGYEAVDSVLNVANSYGGVTVFKLYMEAAADEPSSLSPAVQSQLKLCGVSLVQCSRADSNVPIKLSTDMLIFAVDTPAPATIMLISGNHAFTYPISLLRFRGYHVVLVVPTANHTREGLESLASVVLDWKMDILHHGQFRRESTTSFVNDPDDKAESPASRQISIAALKHHYSGSFRGSHQASLKNEVASSTRPSEVAKSWRNADAQPPSPRLALDPDFNKNESNNLQKPRRLPPSPFADKTHNPSLPSPSTSLGRLPRLHFALPELANPRPLQTFRYDQTGTDRPIEPSKTKTFNAPHHDISTSVDLPSSSGTGGLSTSRTSLYRNTPHAQEHLDSNPESSLQFRIRAKMRSTEALPPRQVAHAVSKSSPHDRKAMKLPSRDLFLPLIQELQALELDGNRQPLRSLVGTRLSKALYNHAGVADFSQYVALAESAGIIQLGGSKGESWITLQPTARDP